MCCRCRSRAVDEVGLGVDDVDGGSCHSGVITGENLLVDDVDVVGNSRGCRRGMQAMVGADVTRISGNHGVQRAAALYLMAWTSSYSLSRW